jgi:tetratricopeptide (TPR) repeat protein
MTRARWVVALSIFAAAQGASASPLWDDVAHPARRRCIALLEQAKQARAHDLAANASALLRKAATSCPDDRDVLQALGETLLATHELDEARQVLERAQLAAVDKTVTHEAEVALAFHLGFAREVTGDLMGAIEAHRALEAMGGLPPPNRYLVHYDLADELMAVGRLAEAIDEYRTAVALAPDKPVVRLALAVALDRDGQVAKSRAEVDAVLSLDPELYRLSSGEYVFVPPGDEHYYRALGWAARGAIAEARVETRLFLARLPDSPYVEQARQRLAALEQQLDSREIEGAAGDAPLVARALAPLVLALEECLPGPEIARVGLVWMRAGIRTRPEHPAAVCLDRVLQRAALPAHRPAAGSFTIPLAGRRSLPALE